MWLLYLETRFLGKQRYVTHGEKNYKEERYPQETRQAENGKKIKEIPCPHYIILSQKEILLFSPLLYTRWDQNSM